MVILYNVLFYCFLLSTFLVEACYITALAKVNQNLHGESRVTNLIYTTTESKDISVTINVEQTLSFFLNKMFKLKDKHDTLKTVCNQYENVLSKIEYNPIEIIDKENKPSIADQFLKECCNVFDKENC